MAGLFDFFGNLFSRQVDEHAESGASISGAEGSSGTATRVGGGERFHTTFAQNDPTMMKQLPEARKYTAFIEEAARVAQLPPSVICGIGSRESHWGLALKPPNPGGRGDFAKRKPRGVRTGLEPNDGGGYGRGLMQIDYDWHEFARTGPWYDPRENILYGAKVLSNARRFFEQRNVSEPLIMQAIIAAYNAGATATYSCIEQGNDIDCRTTGRDYSRDVLNRAGWFQLQGWS